MLETVYSIVMKALDAPFLCDCVRAFIIVVKTRTAHERLVSFSDHENL